MKIALYIDFDGVILDTLSKMYQEAETNNINLKDAEVCRKFFIEYDWYRLLRESDILADSINNIKKLQASGLFDIAILTHVYSDKEALEKKSFLDQYLPGINMISVPKINKKTEIITNVKGSILVDDYKPNLKDWEEAGGIAYRFCIVETDNQFESINSLEDLLFKVQN